MKPITHLKILFMVAFGMNVIPAVYFGFVANLLDRG